MGKEGRHALCWTDLCQAQSSNLSPLDCSYGTRLSPVCLAPCPRFPSQHPRDPTLTAEWLISQVLSTV